MIKLDIQDYCQECMDFSPDVDEPVRMFSGDDCVFQTNTVIRCEHRRRCEAIKRYLEKQAKENADAGQLPESNP